MKFSYNWLRDLVDGLDATPADVARLITIHTAECEGVEQHVYNGGDDHVIEIDNKSLTHRPDLWGHYGMAREVAAICRKKLIDPVESAQFPGSAPVKVTGSGGTRPASGGGVTTSGAGGTSGRTSGGRSRGMSYGASRAREGASILMFIDLVCPTPRVGPTDRSMK